MIAKVDVDFMLIGIIILPRRFFWILFPSYSSLQNKSIFVVVPRLTSFITNIFYRKLQCAFAKIVFPKTTPGKKILARLSLTEKQINVKRFRAVINHREYRIQVVYKIKKFFDLFSNLAESTFPLNFHSTL